METFLSGKKMIMVMRYLHRMLRLAPNFFMDKRRGKLARYSNRLTSSHKVLECGHL